MNVREMRRLCRPFRRFAETPRHAAGHGEDERLFGTWLRTAGPSVCTLPMTRRSAALWMFMNPSTGKCRLTDSTGFSTTETVSDRNLHRIRALGGGIAVQDRIAFRANILSTGMVRQRTERTPPIRRMLEMGTPVGAGTDATRVASYNPFVSLYWLVTGKTVGGTALYPEKNRLDRTEALRLYTIGSSWFSSEEGKKGSITGAIRRPERAHSGLICVPEEEIKQLESVLTIVGGRIVHAEDEFRHLGRCHCQSALTGHRSKPSEDMHERVRGDQRCKATPDTSIPHLCGF